MVNAVRLMCARVTRAVAVNGEEAWWVLTHLGCDAKEFYRRCNKGKYDE
jgi:hypothetical protein